MQRLVVKLTAGVDEAEKVSQAFTVAVAAISAGATVSVWLTGEASWLAVPGKAEQFSLPGATPLSELRDMVLTDGRLTLCTQCASRRGLSQEDLIPGVQISGAASFVEESLTDGTQALVY